MAALTNQRFQSWVARELIGSGGVAEVYRAEHSDDARQEAALKALRPEKTDRAQSEALEREFELMKSLDHPSIPKARRFGAAAQRPAILMDFVPGLTLARIALADGAFDRPRAALDLCRVVAYLHREGLIHNDLKPENVVIADDGNLALVDFGSARRPRGTSLFRRFLGRPKAFFGTAGYVAPEVIVGHQPTCGSDVYALGLCIYLILSGATPFLASSRSSRLRANLHAEAPSIAEHLPQMPQRMARTIDACLDKRPSARPDAADLLAAVTGIENVSMERPAHSRRFVLRTSRRTKTQQRKA